MILKNSENNGTEEIGLVTPTPGPLMIIGLSVDYYPYGAC